MLICAIDPGLKGALAIYDPDFNFLHTVPLPTRWRMVANKKRFEIDIPALCAEFNKWPITKFLVEEPGAMPGMGATSSFSFGTSCGAIMAAIEVYIIEKYHGQSGTEPVVLMRIFPAVWKTAMKIPSDKNRAREAAAALFPLQAKEQWHTQSEEGRAEAALLAWYAVNAKEIKQKERTPYVKGKRQSAPRKSVRQSRVAARNKKP